MLSEDLTMPLQTGHAPMLFVLAFIWGCGGGGEGDPAHSPSNTADVGAEDGGSTDSAAVAADNNIGAEDAGEALVLLITPDAWEVVTDETENPFADLRPEGVECDPQGYQVEQLTTEWVFSIDTWLCNYITIRQPLMASVKAGDVIQGRLWHFDLTAPEPDVKAYAAYLLQDEQVWEHEVNIPTTSGLILPEWTAKRDAPEGTPIYFHLNNHGANSWSLIDLVVLPPER